MVWCGGIICLMSATITCAGGIWWLVICVMFLVLCLGVWHELVAGLDVYGFVIMFGWLLGVCGMVMLYG